MDYKNVPARKAVNYLLTGKNTSRGWDNRESQGTDFGWFDTLRGQCRVSVRSRALRSGQLGSSEWDTTLWNTG